MPEKIRLFKSFFACNYTIGCTEFKGQLFSMFIFICNYLNLCYIHFYILISMYV